MECAYDDEIGLESDKLDCLLFNLIANKLVEINLTPFANCNSSNFVSRSQWLSIKKEADEFANV